MHAFPVAPDTTPVRGGPESRLATQDQICALVHVLDAVLPVVLVQDPHALDGISAELAPIAGILNDETEVAYEHTDA